MILEQFKIAIEEFIVSEVIKRGKLLSGTDSGAIRLVIEKMCTVCCGGRWEFGSYFFIDDSVRVYFRYINEEEDIREVSKHIYSKREIEDLVFKYIENEDIFKYEKEEKETQVNKTAKTSKKLIKKDQVEQMSLF